MANKMQDDFVLGAVAGGIIYALVWLVNALKIPMLQVTFGTIEVPLRDQLLAAPSEIGKGILGLLGGVFSLPAMLVTAIGMGAIYLVGSIIVDQIKLKMTKMQKVATILALGSVVLGWIISKSIQIPMGGVLVVLVVVSFATAWIMTVLEGQKLIKIST